MTTRLRHVGQCILALIAVVALASCREEPTYTITFDTDTDVTIEPIVALAGEAVFAPEDPVRDGYRFDGWLLDGETFLFGTMPEENLELSANWSQYYTITFVTDGGTEVDSIDIVEGDAIVLPEGPTKDHYKFTHWSYLGADFDLETMPSGDITLNAIWAPASTITFDVVVYDRYLDEDVVLQVDPLVEIAGEDIAPPPNPTYDEYQFSSWQLDGVDFDFTTMPDEDITLTANWLQLSNLPALFIDLYDEADDTYPLDFVNREVYVTSSITITNTQEDHQIHQASALFKGRGNGSWVDSGDKLGYRIKFDDDQSILGESASRHWVILAGANFDDVTMWRNKLAFTMANAVFSNIDYASSAHWVDVYVNGEYQGVYLIAEHVRVDDERIAIESEYGVEDTGYLIEYDAYASGENGVDYFRIDGVRHPFSMKYPEPDEYLENGYTKEQYQAQVTYIQGLVQNMVDAIMDKDMEAFEQYADLDSFIDMYILHELFKNIDTGYSSFFLAREPGGKIHATAPWDFDATCGSTPSRGNGSPTGIYVALAVQAFSARTASEMLITLYDTPEFLDAVIARWTEISPDIQTFLDQTLTDEMVETNRFAMGRNYVLWPPPQGYGAPLTQEEAEADWADNIDILYQWMTDRVAWLDTEWSTN